MYVLVIEPGTPHTLLCPSPALSHYSYTFVPLPCQLGTADLTWPLAAPILCLNSGSSLPLANASCQSGFHLILLFRFTLRPGQQRACLVMTTACGEQEPREEIEKEYQKTPLMSLSALLTQGCPAVPGVGEHLSEGQPRSPQSWYATSPPYKVKFQDPCPGSESLVGTVNNWQEGTEPVLSCCLCHHVYSCHPFLIHTHLIPPFSFLVLSGFDSLQFQERNHVWTP